MKERPCLAIQYLFGLLMVSKIRHTVKTSELPKVNLIELNDIISKK